MDVHLSELPIQLCEDLAHSLAEASVCKDGILGSPVSIITVSKRGHLQSGWNDGMDYSSESFSNTKVVVGDHGHGD